MDANLIKKYHQELVFNYAEYPTCDHWDYNYGSSEYKNALSDWMNNNQNEEIFFYVHVPFCEELCYFCTCSKYITKDYSTVSDYLHEFLSKEIDLLFSHLESIKQTLNVKTLFFGGGSPTFFSKKDLKILVDKLRNNFDFDNLGYFTIEIDPRRVDEERLLYNHEICGANRLSFGLQDFDPDVQRRINRVQPPEIFEKILTTKVRNVYKTIAFDLLIGLPGQNVKTMEKTCDQIIELQPTIVQLSLMAYKPWIAKYQIKMLDEGPLPDFLDRREMLHVIHSKLEKAGYVRVGFECYALPDEKMTKAYNEGTAHYGAAGHQTGGRVNFVAVGSSSKSNFGDEYYSQNYYDLKSYKNSLKEKQFPILRGMKLKKDDQIRQYVTQQLRSYFRVDFKYIEKHYGIIATEYFKKEIDILQEYIDDGLLEISEDNIKLSSIGRDFSQNITNVFDAYDPPEKSFSARLKTIKKSKEKQAKLLG